MQARLSMSHLQVIAKAYDNPIPGYGTATVGNLRLWESLPVNELNLGLFNEGKFNEVCACAQDTMEASHVTPFVHLAPAVL